MCVGVRSVYLTISTYLYSVFILILSLYDMYAWFFMKMYLYKSTYVDSKNIPLHIMYKKSIASPSDVAFSDWPNLRL
jgi:hypothetical protein